MATRGSWIITGASSGFGRQLTERVLEQGGRVAAMSRNIDGLAALAEVHRGRLHRIVVDVRDVNSVKSGMHAAADALGHADVLVNNAGRGLFAGVEEASEEELLDVFETNVFGVVRVLRGALPLLRKSKRARVFQVSSAVGHASMPFAGLYAATKHAVEALSEALSGELASSGIEVCIVEPGYFATNFASSMAIGASLPHYEKERAATLQQWGAMPPGDARLVVDRILELADGGSMPARIAIGADALPWIESSLQRRLAQVRSRP
jgi:NAD(P)-dependent dehydrogenase (short-subunit alcohol dehydrogenase family)